MKTLDVKLTFSEGVLGTSPKNENIYRDFIGSKAPDTQTVDEEVEALSTDAEKAKEDAEKGMTVFPRDEDGNPFVYDYQIKGFFKDACKMLRNVPGTEASKLSAYKGFIDGLIFVSPRQIVLNGDLGTCQRPLRAETMQGPRVALAMSEEVTNASCEFEINILTETYIPNKTKGKDSAVDCVKLVRELLDYGQYRGIGQWRNSGKGRYSWEELECY